MSALRFLYDCDYDCDPGADDAWSAQDHSERRGPGAGSGRI